MGAAHNALSQPFRRLDVLDLEIPTVGYDRDLFDTEDLFSRRRRLGEQPHVNNLVRDLLLHDQLVLGVHRYLDVVADRNVPVRGHGPAVGVSERDLILTSAVEFRQHFLASRAAVTDRGDFLGQVLDPRATGFVLVGSARVETLKVIVELGIGQLDELGQRTRA